MPPSIWSIQFSSDERHNPNRTGSDTEPCLFTATAWLHKLNGLRRLGNTTDSLSYWLRYLAPVLAPGLASIPTYSLTKSNTNSHTNSFWLPYKLHNLTRSDSPTDPHSVSPTNSHTDSNLNSFFSCRLPKLTHTDSLPY